MYRGDWVDIVKSQHFGVLVNFSAGYLSAHDLAE
jgi:hypothetical protein